MTSLRVVMMVVAVSVACSTATVAFAQAAPPVTVSFAELEGWLPSGDTLKVVSAAGVEVKGKFRRFDVAGLVVEVGGADVVLAEDDVRAITWEEKDSLRNGILIGMGVGAGTAAGLSLLACTNGCDAGNVAEAAVISAFFFGAIGGGIGAAIDYAVKTDRLVYVGSSRRALEWDVAPIIARGAKGAALTIRF